MKTRLVRLLMHRNFGLRARILGVVVITTTVTLGVAALLLLPRLEHSLRNAAMKTLQTEVASASRDHVFQRAAWSHYPELASPEPRKSPAGRKERQLANSLIQDEYSLRERLGATTVTLIGYVDQLGNGHPVVPVVSADGTFAVSSSASDALAGAPYDDVQTAYTTGQRVYYSFGGNSQVRAAVVLKGADAVLAVRKSIDEIPTAVATVRRSFEIAVIPGILLTLMLAVPLVTKLVRRLRVLRQAALRLAVDGGGGADFPADRARDEVGDLARSFAIVQRRLRQQEEARRAFVSTASHELRTPLASLEGMLELLEEDLNADPVDLEDAAALLERARAQSRRLARLASDLLDLSRLDAEVEVRSEPVELNEIGRAVLAEFELRALERHVAPLLDDPNRPIWALADPGGIAQILRILLDNALRVAPPGSQIVVAVTGGHAPAISVIDQGPGVRPEDREQIFERFKRGRETGGFGGFGLGLAIGRELAERMGGSLVLADDGGSGATFTLTLRPTVAPAQPPRRTIANV